MKLLRSVVVLAMGLATPAVVAVAVSDTAATSHLLLGIPALPTALILTVTMLTLILVIVTVVTDEVARRIAEHSKEEGRHAEPMPLADQAQVQTRWIWRWSRWRRLPSLIAATIPYMGAVVTFVIVYYDQSGHFVFHVKAWLDYLVAAFIVFLIAIGTLEFVRTYSFSNRIIVTRDDLVPLQRAARSNASQSAVTLATNLIWLPDELPAFAELPAGVDVAIFCDRNNMDERILQYARKGARSIKVQPYPEGLSLDGSTRYVMIDLQDDSARCLFSFRRRQASTAGASSRHDRFDWEQHGPESAAAFHLALLVQDLLKVPQPLRIGVCGTTNLGKTPLAMRIAEHIRVDHRFDTRVVEDVYTSMHSGDELRYTALLEQTREEARADAPALIYDRTSIDQLAFINCLSADGAKFAKDESDRIADWVKQQYDFLIELRPAHALQNSGRLVKAEKRSEVANFIEEFLNRHSLRRMTVPVNEPHISDEEIEDISSQVSGMVTEFLAH